MFLALNSKFNLPCFERSHQAICLPPFPQPRVLEG